MTEGPDQNQDTVERLQGELDELMRQHEQYTLALDAAMDPRTSLRLQRTLERLDEEIEGLQEAIKAYEVPETEQQDSGQAVLPEWDEDEEEPATSIYTGLDSDQVGLGPSGPGLRGFVPGVQAAMPSEDPPTVSLQAPSPVQGPSGQTDSLPTAVQQQAGQPGATAQIVDPPTTNINPPVQPEPDEAQLRYERPAAPPGGASFTSLPPPAGLEDAQWGHTEIVPPSYETQPRPKAQPAGSSAAGSSAAGSSAAGSSASPFGAPPPLASQSQPGAESPFGSPPVSRPPGAGFGNTGGYGIVDRGDSEWSLGSRLLLAFLVLLFLAGVGWILSQGP